jgi:hypothetical protein
MEIKRKMMEFRKFVKKLIDLLTFIVDVNYFTPYMLHRSPKKSDSPPKFLFW